MGNHTIAIVKQVLMDAADLRGFFCWSDLDRLKWMISRAYELGQHDAGPRVRSQSRIVQHSRPAAPPRRTSEVDEAGPSEGER